MTCILLVGKVNRKRRKTLLLESERARMFNIENFSGQYQQETSHALRFEADDFQKIAPVTQVLAAATPWPLVHKSQPMPLLPLPSYQRQFGSPFSVMGV